MRRTLVIGMVMVAALAAPRNADAYIGPGIGIGMLGTAVGFISLVLSALFGLVWYPIQRMVNAIKARLGRSDPGGDSRTVAP